MRTCSISMRISSTPLLDAASSSWMLYDLCWLNATHDSQLLHASLSGVRFMQLIVFAKMRAQVVLPTPRGPLKRYACASLLPTMALDRKSTRLNSSHVRISYAVFCLKKKNPKDAAANHHTNK